MTRSAYKQRDEFGLLPKWRLFADEVLAGNTATHAYATVYGAKPKCAMASGPRLRQNPVVAEYIEGRQDRVRATALEKLQVDADRIVADAVEVVERCMGRDPDNPGTFDPDNFDAAGATRALKLLSENCPEWGAQKPQMNGLPVFVVLTR